MKSVTVRYTVTEAFAETNAANIQKVMSDMKELADDGIRYQAFRLEDGVSFVHFGMYADQAAVERATSLPSFKEFQTALKASGLVSPPKAETLNLVGTSYPLF